MRYLPCIALVLFLPKSVHAGVYKEVVPLPGREKVMPEKPSWCPAGLLNSKLNGKVTEHDVESDLEDLSNRFNSNPEDTMGRAGWIACQYGDSPHAQKRVAAWRQEWINTLGLTMAEDRVILKNAMLGDSKETESWCKVAPNPDDSFKTTRVRFVKETFCLGSNPNSVLNRAGKGSLRLGYYLDRGSQVPSELVRAIHVFNCFGTSTDAVGYCGADADAVNPVRAQAELDELKGPPAVKAMLGVMIGVARMNVQRLRDVAATESAANPNRKKVLEAGQRAIVDARKEYADHKDIYDGLYVLEDKIAAIPFDERLDRDAHIGCDDVRALFQKQIKSVNPKTRDEIWDVTGATSLGYAATSHFAMCVAAEGDIPTAVVAYQLARIRHKAFAGERFAAVRAMEEEVVKQADKGQHLTSRAFALQADAAMDNAFFKIDNKTSYKRIGNLDYAPPGAGYTIGSDPYKESGVVASVTKTAAGYHVKFKSEKYELPEFKCVSDGLSSYEPDGTPIYYRKCTYVRSTWETWTPSEHDLTIYASDSIKPGVFTNVLYIVYSSDRTPPKDVVFEVYSSAPKNGKTGKLVSYFGIAL